MNDNTSNSKRIVKNTILLYFRMLVTMLVGLFTSRIVLDALGVEDFGIYNLVGGFVLMFSIVRAGLVSSTQRFLNFELGKGNVMNLNKTFSTITLIYVFLCTLIFVIAEISGYWFIENKLSIPNNRIYAAKFVFQLSLVTLIFTLISSSYNSLIIAHEKMKAFAYITIFEVFAKLIVAYVLYITTFDSLIIYSLLLCIVQISVPILYWIYCKKNFKYEVAINWKIDLSKVREIYAFAGWSMMGGIAYIGFTQGVNILLGMFFSPVVNAARGIAVQIQGVISQFVTNFQLAIDPQIIKSYARGDLTYMSNLISTSSRFSFYLLFFVSLPVMIEADYLLSIWLVQVPADTSLFFRLIIITTMFDSVANPFEKAINATGVIRNYQITCSSIMMMIVPISYIVLMLGAPAYSVFIVHICLGFIAMICRILLAGKSVGITFKSFLSKSGILIIYVSLLSPLLPIVFYTSLEQNIFRFIIVAFCCMISVAGSIWFFGITLDERSMFKSKVLKFLVHKS